MKGVGGGGGELSFTSPPPGSWPSFKKCKRF